jgi:hypothetical protein
MGSSKASAVVRAKDEAWCELAREAVILNLKSRIYLVPDRFENDLRSFSFAWCAALDGKLR